jgi:hypothetical protein
MLKSDTVPMASNMCGIMAAYKNLELRNLLQISTVALIYAAAFPHSDQPSTLCGRKTVFLPY